MHRAPVGVLSLLAVPLSWEGDNRPRYSVAGEPRVWGTATGRPTSDNGYEHQGGEGVMGKKESQGTGIALGLTFGVAFWLIFDSLALGLALGMVFGLAFGAHQSRRGTDRPPSDSA
jgi:hypothetical protein